MNGHKNMSKILRVNRLHLYSVVFCSWWVRHFVSLEISYFYRNIKKICRDDVNLLEIICYVLKKNFEHSLDDFIQKCVLFLTASHYIFACTPNCGFKHVIVWRSDCTTDQCQILFRVVLILTSDVWAIFSERRKWWNL